MRRIARRDDQDGRSRPLPPAESRRAAADPQQTSATGRPRAARSAPRPPKADRIPTRPLNERAVSIRDFLGFFGTERATPLAGTQKLLSGVPPDRTVTCPTANRCDDLYRAQSVGSPHELSGKWSNRDRFPVFSKLFQPFRQFIHTPTSVIPQFTGVPLLSERQSLQRRCGYRYAFDQTRLSLCNKIGNQASFDHSLP